MDIKNLQKQILELKFKDNNWYNLLRGYLLSEDFTKALDTLHSEFKDGKYFTPNIGKVFRPFELTDPNTIKVVILAEEPYSSMNTSLNQPVADGLALSCSGEKIAQPALRLFLNAINKSVYNYGHDPEQFDLDLSYLAQQGVLLLNSSLTTQVGKRKPSEIWTPFINYVIDMINNKNLIWVFLGNAAKYEDLVTSDYKIIASHPNEAYLNKILDWDCNDMFNKVNEFLTLKKQEVIVW